VVVNHFNVRRAFATLEPFEADAPLIAYSNAVLSLAIALQRLKAIARQVQIT
jgi:hypothetical protein